MPKHQFSQQPNQRFPPFSPCIMCVQYRGGAQYCGGVQYRGRYHEYCGGYVEYRGGVQYCGGYHDKCGDILSTVGGYLEYRGGYHDTRGGYHEYRGGCSVLWGENLLLFEYPTVLNTPTVLIISPHSTQILKDGIPPWY